MKVELKKNHHLMKENINDENKMAELKRKEDQILTKSIEFEANEYVNEKLSLEDKFCKIWLNPDDSRVYL